MANINSIHSVGGPGGIDPSRSEKSQNTNSGKKGLSFSDILDKTESPGGASKAGATPAAENTSAIPPAYIGPLASPTSVRDSVLRASGEFFDLMESFQSQLGSPASSLKDIAPLMSQMETQRDQLMNEISALPKGDTGRGILEEMASVISSESAKFHRGDYI